MTCPGCSRGTCRDRAKKSRHALAKSSQPWQAERVREAATGIKNRDMLSRKVASHDRPKE